MSESLSFLIIIQLRGDCLVDQPAFDAGSLLESILDLSVDSVVEPWDGWEESWLQNSDIVGKLEDVSSEETTLKAIDEGVTKGCLFEGVSCWQV
jgi:hypothetical protein